MVDLSLLRLPRFLTVFPDNLAHLFYMLPRMQRRPFRGLLALVKVLQHLERALGPGPRRMRCHSATAADEMCRVECGFDA